MSVEWSCTGDIKRCLIYQLINLENTRNAINEELFRFTEKTAEEVEAFLHNPSLSSAHDSANLLKTLDAKCRVIKELMSVFQGLKSASEPQSLKIHLTHRVSLWPRSGRQNLFIPKVLKFGPLLQNVIQESSIAKAVQIIGATHSLQQMTLSRESGKEEEEESSSTEISTNYRTEIELSNQDASKASGLETAKTDVLQKIIPTEAETQRNFADICPSLISNVTTHVLEQPFVNDPKVQHQKQTSSELMHFLRMIGKTKNVSEISCVERAFMLMQQEKPNIEGMKRQSFAEMKVSGPIFKVKTSSADFVTYTCMIATHSELWDIGDISIEVKTSKVSRSNGVTFPNCNDSKLLDLFSETVCTSGNESVTSDNLEPQCTFEEQADKTTDVSLVRIPEFQIKKFQEIPVLVSHVISPSRFHIQQEDANLQKMSEVMERTRQKSCAEKHCVPDIGTYVMGWFPEQRLWCRAQVTKICGMNRGEDHLCTCLDGVKNLEVEVRRIDYGDSACLSLSNVKELCGEIAKVPLQALQVSLANVNPVNGQNWSAEAINWFKDKVNGRTLYARLYPEGSKVMVELFMEKGKIGAMRRGASLSLRLAQNGHARHEQMKSMGLKRSHAQEQSRKQSAEWEKYLISRYSQNRK